MSSQSKFITNAIEDAFAELGVPKSHYKVTQKPRSHRCEVAVLRYRNGLPQAHKFPVLAVVSEERLRDYIRRQL